MLDSPRAKPLVQGGDFPVPLDGRSPSSLPPPRASRASFTARFVGLTLVLVEKPKLDLSLNCAYRRQSGAVVLPSVGERAPSPGRQSDRAERQECRAHQRSGAPSRRQRRSASLPRHRTGRRNRAPGCRRAGRRPGHRHRDLHGRRRHLRRGGQGHPRLRPRRRGASGHAADRHRQRSGQELRPRRRRRRSAAQRAGHRRGA